MSMLFSDDNYIECPECGSKEFHKKDICAYKKFEAQKQVFYKEVYLGSDLQCANCGNVMKGILNKERVVKSV